MTLTELVKQLGAIIEAHPEAGESQVWAVHPDYTTFRVFGLGIDKRHHPNRIKLEG